MGIFGGGYLKPGPGVDKDEPKKKGIFLYTEIFGRKFWKIMQLNLIYFLCSLPFIFLMYIIAPISGELVKDMAKVMNPSGENVAEIASTIQLGFRAMFAIGVTSFWGFAIVSPAYAYITRCFTREQHTWVWSDFREKVKENFKQSIAVFVIDIIVILLGINALYFYFTVFKSTNQNMWLFACYLIATALLVFTMMHYYIFQLMVTFNSKLGQLYKNACLLTFAKLPMNLFLTLIGGVLIYFLFMVINPVVAIILSAILWISVIRFPIEFYSARVIKGQILDRYDDMENKPDDREYEEWE